MLPLPWIGPSGRWMIVTCAFRKLADTPVQRTVVAWHASVTVR
jgi:hypothetical protein